MVRERVVTELVVQGAQQFLDQFSTASQAVTDLTTRLSDTERIRTPQLAPQINEITKALQASTSAALKFGQSLGPQTLGPFIASVVQTNTAVEKLVGTISNVNRIRTTQLAGQFNEVSTAIQRTSQAAETAARVQTNLNQQQLRGAQAAIAAQRQLAATQRAQAPPSQAAFIGQLGEITTRSRQVAVESDKKTRAIHNQTGAETRAKSSGITYLSTLSAIHAASFLLSNRTFTLVGSLFTLGAAFSKLGPQFVAAGAAFGTILIGVNALLEAGARIQQFFITVADVAAKASVAIAATGVAAGIAAVKIAADVETQFALIRAVSGASIAQLQELEKVVSNVAIQFGISAEKVAEGASLFIRAGGGIESALQGATEAVAQLVVASSGELQAAQAAVALAAGINQFNLAASEAIRVANVLVGAAQASALSFTGVTQAFVQAAPGARNLGIDIETLGAGIALLGDRLVKGTITGTAFKQFILDLIKPSKQAQETLNKFGISIKDASGNIRPFADFIFDLNKALGDQAVATGKVTDAERNRALVSIFASRAYLAASILTHEGAEALEAYKAELEAVTAVDVARILLLPLNKQFEILITVVREVARAFGGPLLAPIRAATVQLIEFAKSLIEPAKTAAAAIVAIGQAGGFGQLQERINALTDNPKLLAFFNAILNSALSIRNAIVSQLAPAFVELGTKIATAISNINFEQTFGGLTTIILRAIAGVTQLVTFLSDLAVEFINNEGRGRELRDTISGLVTVIGTSLVGALVTSAAAIAVVIGFMSSLGKAILQTAESANEFTTFWGFAWDVALATVDNFIRLLFPRARAIAETFVDLARVIERALSFDLSGAQAALDQFLAAREAVQATFLPIDQQRERVRALQGVVIDLQKQLDVLPTRFAEIMAQPESTQRTQELKNLAENAKQLEFDLLRATTQLKALGGVESATLLREGLSAAITKLRELQSASVSLDDILGFQEGDISEFLTNITKGLEEAQRRVAGIFTPETTGAVDLVDEKGIDRAKQRIEEAGRDLARRLENLREDTATRIVNIQERALERIDDITNKAQEQLSRLARDTKERIDDLNEAFARRRFERDLLEQAREILDDQIEAKQKALDREERDTSRTLDRIRLLRQREAEDTQRIYDLEADAAERAFSRAQDAAERSLRNIQRARDQALEQAQSAEERALQTRLRNEADVRQLAQDLAAAKTPAEKQQIQQRAAQARQDQAFAARQQSQLDALRQRQDAARQALARQAENEQIAFRRTQEAALLQFRLQAEAAALRRRRQLEDAETRLRQIEDDKAQLSRRGREQELRNLREQNAKEIQHIQDTLDEENHQRQLARIRREAEERRKDITTQARTQIGEVLDQVTQQLTELERTQTAQIRNILQSFEDTIDGLDPAVRAAVGPLIDFLKLNLLGTSEEVINNLLIESDKLRAIVGAQRELGLTRISTGAGPTGIGGAFGARVAAPLPFGSEQVVSRGVFNGLLLASQQGIIPAQTITINVTGGAADVAAAIRRELQTLS